jgi:hypothetical protein
MSALIDHVRRVDMFVAVCPLCRDVVSAAPRPTTTEATDDLAAHLRVVHERPSE